MRLNNILLVIIFLGITGLAQSPVESLYAKKCKADESICDTQEIVRYDFQNGELKSRTVVFTSQTKDIRFDLGGNQIVNGNILLSHWGGVIDLRSGKVLFKHDGELVAMIGSTLVFDCDNVKDDDLYTFDLKTHAEGHIKSRKDIEDLDDVSSHMSPNGRLMAKSNGSLLLKSVFEFLTIDESLNIKRIRTVSGEFSGSCSIRCNDMSRTPFIWLDNSRLLTQRVNGDLVTVDIAGKVRKIVKIKIDDEPDSIPSFERDGFGNVFYEVNGKSYLIDVKNKTYSSDWLPLGNGFSETDSNTFSSEYFYNRESIGKVWSGGALSSKNYLAVVYAKDGKNLGYPDGFKVWSPLTKKWITIDESWGIELIDWVY